MSDTPISDAELDRREEARLRAEDRRNASLERRAQMKQEEIDKLQDELKLEEKLESMGKGRVGFSKQQLEFRQETLAIQKQELELKAKAKELGRDLTDEEIKRLAIRREALEAEKAGAAAAQDTLQSVLGIRKQTGLMANALKDPMGALAGAFGSLKDLSTGDIIASVAQNSIDLALQQDQAAVNFRIATSAGLEYDKTLRGLERSLYFSGITAEEAGQTLQSLFENVSDFSEMNEETRKELGTTVALLNEVGVAAETSSQNIQFAIKVLGKSTADAEKLQRELFTFAQELGVSAKKISEDFQKFGPEIAALGNEGIKAFRQLEVQAKNTGLQMEELLGITKQFDTFDGAAQSVGKLNALLGGPYLNTLELVNATNPAERFELLKDSVDRAGKSFEQMEYYERKALAAAVGLNEEQLGLMMNSNLSLIKEPAKTAAEIAEIQKQTAQFNDVMTELSQIGMGLVVSLGPLISLFKSGVQLLNDFMPLIEAAAIGLMTYGAATTAYSAAAGIASFMTAGWSVKMAILSNIMAVGAIGAVLALTYGVYKLAEWLMPGKGPLVLGLAAASVALLYFGTSMGVATFGLLPLIGLLITGIIKLGTMIYDHMFSPSLIDILGILAGAFFLLPPAMVAFTAGVLVILPILPLLGIAIWAIMGRLRKLSEILPPLAVGFAMIGAVVKDVFTESMVEAVRNLAIEIANIVESINELDESKAIVFAATTAVTAGVGVATGAAEAALGSIGLSVPAGGGAAGAGGATGEGPTINVSLNIDGTEFATAVNNVEVSKYNSEGQSDMYKSVVEMIAAGITKGT